MTPRENYILRCLRTGRWVRAMDGHRATWTQREGEAKRMPAREAHGIADSLRLIGQPVALCAG